MPALFLILIISVDPLLSSTRNAFKEHTGPAIFLPLWLKILLWLPSTLGIMDKLRQPTRACLVFEHYLLSYRDLVLGFSFLKNTKFVSRACAPGHLPAAEAFSSASYSRHSPASYPCVLSPSLRGLPAPAAVDTGILGSHFQHQQLIPPAAARGWQLSTLSCQLSVGMPSTVRSPSPKVIPPFLHNMQTGPVPSC